MIKFCNILCDWCLYLINALNLMKKGRKSLKVIKLISKHEQIINYLRNEK